MDTIFHESDERLELYALDRLSDSDVIRIEEHLLICDLCRDKLDEAATFAFSVREELRNHPLPVPSHERAGVLDGLLQGLRGWMKPQFALAGALAIALVSLVVFRAGNTPLAPVATLQLTAMRGADVKAVAAARELDLTFGDVSAAGSTLSVEVVDAGGAPVWQGSPQVTSGAVRAKIAKALSPGEYFARLYDSPGHLVHEYAFRVKE